jgi:predicted transposase YbfD/YdcC
MTVTKSIREMSEGIEDPRCACDVKIPLYDVLAVSIAAILCGQEELSSMMDYIDVHADELTAQFGLSSIPSESTLRRVLSLINPLQFGIACLGLMQRGGIEPGDVIAVDGKAIRSTEKLKSLQRGLRVLIGHGRTEQRTCSIVRMDGLPELQEWSGIALFIAMDRTTEQDGRITQERSYYFSSLLGTATHLWHLIRDHWQIESMHWMLDVTFHEDACRAHNPILQLNLNLLRKLALTILRQHLKRQADTGDKKAVRRSLRQQMNRCLAHVSTLVEVLSQADIASLFAAELDA